MVVHIITYYLESSIKKFISFCWIFFQHFFITQSFISSFNSSRVGLSCQPSKRIPRSFVAAGIRSVKKRVLLKTFDSLSTFRSICCWRYQFDSCIFASIWTLCLDCVCLDLIQRRRVRILDGFVEIIVSRIVVHCCIDTSNSCMYSFCISRFSISWVPRSHV